MLTYRRPASTYALYYASPQARTGRALRAAVRWLARSIPAAGRACAKAMQSAWSARFPLLVGGLMFWPSADNAIQQAIDRAYVASAERDQIASYHAENWADVRISGSPSRVSNLALQVAAAVR